MCQAQCPRGSGFSELPWHGCALDIDQISDQVPPWPTKKCWQLFHPPACDVVEIVFLACTTELLQFFISTKRLSFTPLCIWCFGAMMREENIRGKTLVGCENKRISLIHDVFHILLKLPLGNSLSRDGFTYSQRVSYQM